jgi:hypothetical protein
VQELIRKAAKDRFSEFLIECGRAFPNYIQVRYAKKINPILAVIYICIFIVGGLLAILFFSKSKKGKYFFQGARFPDIHDLFPPERVVIIGGIKDLRYARSKGYGFHWDGYIRKLFNIFYFSQSRIAFDVLFFIVRNLLGRQIGIQGRLFLFEDTVQIGVPLATILRDITPVVCIAHGFFAKANNGFNVVCDGDLCSFNFIYEHYQKDFYYRDKETCFALGLPYDVPLLDGVSRDIVLVEQSTTDMPEEYTMCLNRMRSLAEILNNCGYKLTYRSRPGVASPLIMNDLCSIHSGDKMELLGGSRKIFIGFNSTLLYEAGVAGHVTIALNDGDLSYNRAFTVDFFISEIKRGLVRAVLELALTRLETPHLKQIEPLRVRFGRCLSMMDEHLVSNKINQSKYNKHIDGVLPNEG